MAKEMPMKKLLAATLVALLPVAVIAAGDDPTSSSTTSSRSQDSSFEALDANKDGRISMPEASADPKLVESFATIDKDADGYLDATEYANSKNMPPRQN